jgi:hypothetical protein
MKDLARDLSSANLGQHIHPLSIDPTNGCWAEGERQGIQQQCTTYVEIGRARCMAKDARVRTVRSRTPDHELVIKVPAAEHHRLPVGLFRYNWLLRLLVDLETKQVRSGIVARYVEVILPTRHVSKIQVGEKDRLSVGVWTGKHLA